jgi:hypothetical protein
MKWLDNAVHRLGGFLLLFPGVVILGLFVLALTMRFVSDWLFDER